MNNIADKNLETTVTATLQGMGYELWGIEKQPQGKHQLLRIYIEKEGGVGVDDCAKVSRQLSTTLAVESPLAGEYLLEVSSPGMDRILFSLEQCKAYVGKKIKVKLLQAVEQRKKLVGEVKAIQDGQIVLHTEEGDIDVQWNNIAKARLIVTI